MMKTVWVWNQLLHYQAPSLPRTKYFRLDLGRGTAEAILVLLFETTFQRFVPCDKEHCPAETAILL